VATPFRAHATKAEGETGYSTPAKNAQPPEVVAARTLRAVHRGRDVIETSVFVRAATTASRVAPSAFRAVMRRMARRSNG
jgi:short-subunit dehydrogenase